MDFREVFDNGRYRIDIRAGRLGPRITMTDLYSGVVFADGEYRYSALVDDSAEVHSLVGLTEVHLSRIELSDRTIFEITATLGHGAPKITVRHSLVVFPDHEHLEETIGLTSGSSSPLTLRDYRMSFRKHLRFDPKSGAWDDEIGRFRLIAIPFRVQPDGQRYYDYHMDHLYHSQYLASNVDLDINPSPQIIDLGRGRSEAWAWTDGTSGVLINKYNPDMIEYSMLETEQVEDDVFLDFGGAAPSLYGEPMAAKKLMPGEEVAFGVTRYTFYEGLWRRGAYIFRDRMSTLGHGHAEDYSPPLHWVALPSAAHTHSDAQILRHTYTSEMLRSEAETAKRMGCELLFLGSGWETCEGSTTWDESRLGPLEDFIRKMNETYGLKVGLKTVLRCYCNDFPGLYRRNGDGSTGYHGNCDEPGFHEPCTSYRMFLDEKLKGILTLAEAGARFIAFDECDWRGPCYDSEHGHAVPTTPDDHARGMIGLIQRVHEQYPDLRIETPDPVWPLGPRYLPIYYLHGLPGSFDEAWGFGIAENPLDDLLSGRAFALFYYQLAYELPQYLHISMDGDNDDCLAFWWYASTVRRLGIGGGAGNPKRLAAYQKAMAQYLEMKELYARGEFYGYEEWIHLHVLEDEDIGVINAFNLTKEHISRELEISLQDIGLFGGVKVEGAEYRSTGSKLIIQLEIPPMSPIIVKLGR